LDVIGRFCADPSAYYAKARLGRQWLKREAAISRSVERYCEVVEAARQADVPWQPAHSVVDDLMPCLPQRFSLTSGWPNGVSCNDVPEALCRIIADDGTLDGMSAASALDTMVLLIPPAGSSVDAGDELRRVAVGSANRRRLVVAVTSNVLPQRILCEVLSGLGL